MSFPRDGGRQRGMTLIELMVALVIGMVLSLALFGILAVSEGRRRVTTGLNDLEQAGQLSLYLLDQWVRSAGSGFAASASSAYGCTLHANAASGQSLPRTGALPAPFASVNPDGANQFALAPLLILPGATTPGASGKPSDALVVMGGAAGLGGAPLVMTAAPQATSLTVPNSMPFAGGDLLLLVDPSAGVAAPCLLTQVASGFSGGSGTSVSLGGGSFYAASSGGLSLTSLSADTVALPIGAPDTRPPQFLVIGVGDNDTLYSYDLLQMSGAATALQARAQGVFELHAVYGIDSNDDGVVDTWVSAASGDYAASALVAGSSTANTRLQRIKAVRVGLILRVPLAEKEQVGPSSVTLFSDLSGLAYTRTFTGDELRYRYRTAEATLVLRNNILLN